MWIERLDIAGFRRLSGTFEFSKTLTLVVGDNEAGKSSLHEALIRTLFGFSRSERRKVKGRSLRDRFVPWDGREFGLVAHVRTDDERVMRIEWDFVHHHVKLIDDVGTDLSDEVAGRNDEVSLGAYLLQVALEDFREVCCIDQADLAAVRSSPTLGVALQEAVANVRGDTPAADVLARLDDFLRAAIGARVDTLKPSPTGNLTKIARRRDEIRSALARIDEQREELARLARDHLKAREEHDSLADQGRRVKQLLLLAELRDLEDRLEKAESLYQTAAKSTDPSDAMPEDLAATVGKTLAQLEALAAQEEEVERAVNAEAARLTTLESRERELTAKVDGLGAYAKIDDSVADEVRISWGELQASAVQAPKAVPPIPDRDPLLARYRLERDELERLAAPAEPSAARRTLWIALIVLTLGLAILVGKLISRIRGPRRPAALTDRLSIYGAASLEDMEERAADEDLAVAKAEAVVGAFTEQQEAGRQRTTELTEEIESSLDQVSAAVAPTLEQRVTAYLTAVTKLSELTKLTADLERVRRELEEARRPTRERRRVSEERQTRERHLSSAYQSLGIDATDLEVAREIFEARVTADEQVQRERDEAAAAEKTLRSLLRDDTIDGLRQRVNELRARYREEAARFDDLPTDAGSPTELKEESERLEGELQLARDGLTALETEIAVLEKATADPAELKEELAEVENRLEHLIEAKDAIALARETLRDSEESLKRQFAPHLTEALRRSLPRITDGRYTEAFLDGDLTVTVVAPETGRIVSADDLSRATRDQIFLVERLEIARLLAPTKGAAPLLLDDPFAHYDEQRLRQGLHVILEAAQERQIVLFSEDRKLAEVAAEIQDCAVIELPSPLVIA